jgi:predicted component of type VI protein secretion system
MPIHLGRDEQAQFVVNDQRVSRLHAKIDSRNGNFILADLSSYGTWVKFDGNSLELALRRSDCVLTGHGEIALGAPFDDFTVPTVSFQIHTSGR